jgi:hypothetical protein
MSIVEIPACDLARVVPFRANEDVRFYLNGIRIEPYDGGCLLIATNGHWLAVMESKAARADTARILNVSKAFEKALREPMPHDARVTVETETAHSVLIADGEERYVQPGVPFVEGNYPEWRKVMPPSQHLKPGLVAPLQTKYVSQLHKAMPNDHYPGVKFWHDERDPTKRAQVARFGKCPELVVLIMPINEFNEAGWPAWYPKEAVEPAAAAVNS